MIIQLEIGRGSEKPAAHTHHGSQRPRPLPPGPKGVAGLRQHWREGLGCHTDLLTHARAWPACHPQKPFTPAKYFSIDRVFRNETLDATHLAEFHQIEGVVADHGLTLGHLMGVLREFFTKLGEQAGQSGWCWWVTGRRLGHQPDCPSNSVCLPPHPGITQLRFKPAYNPYTEPSMEIFSYHQGQAGTRYWGREGGLGLPTAQPSFLFLRTPPPELIAMPSITHVSRPIVFLPPQV